MPWVTIPDEDGNPKRVRSDKFPPGERCGQKRRDGEPCGAWAKRGTSPAMCAKHGSMLPNVRKVAERHVNDAVALHDAWELSRQSVMLAQTSLREAAPMAVGVLTEMAQDESLTPYVRARVAEALLRFSGTDMSKPDIAVNVVNVNDGREAAEILRERLANLALSFPEVTDSSPAEAAEQIHDAEVIEPEQEPAPEWPTSRADPFGEAYESW